MSNLNPDLKSYKKPVIIIFAVIALIACIGIVGAISVFSVRSNVTVPPGATPTPTEEPEPTETPTNTFTMSATINDTPLADPYTIVIPEGAAVGAVYNIKYTFQSTANQPVTVTVTVPPGETVTGNAAIAWDAATMANNYKVVLPVNGAFASMTMTLTLGTVGGNIPLIFTASPP